MQSDALIVAELTRLLLQARATFLEGGGADGDTPGAERAARDALPIKALQDELAGRDDGPRALLARHLGLQPPEMVLLDLCVALQVDPALEALVASCQGKPWRPAPTEALARRLFDLPATPLWRPTSGLARWRSLDEIADPSGAQPVLRADPRIVDWYHGTLALSADLVDRCAIPALDAPLPAWDFSAEAQIIGDVLQSGQAARVSLVGAQGSGRQLAARALARQMGLPVLLVRGDALEPPFEDAYIRLQRFALLSGRVPVWVTPPRHWPAFRSPAPLQIVLSENAMAPGGGACFDYVIPQPAFGPDLRQAFWQSLSGGRAALPLALAHATPSELATLAPLAAKGPAAVGLYLQQRALSDLDSIGTVRRPHLGWEDIVLPDSVTAALADYASEARLQVSLMGRPEVRRLFAADAAPTALFTGPPGVGKTMAAECIGAELGLPLLVIDVSRTVSKYIGETAKNLSAIVDRARRFGCILFFDEADAFFAKRTDLRDSNDRHANADTNHLLQLIERYEGPVILSSNKPDNMDEAFFRRIRHIIDFHRPDQDQRGALWSHFTRVLAGQGAVTALEAPLRLCAERFELTPAQIKGAVLTAHFDSLRAEAAMDMAHILRGVARELRKDGRSLPSDLVLTGTGGPAHVA